MTPETLGEIYEKRYESWKHYASRYNSREDAEDLVSNAMLASLMVLDKIESEGGLTKQVYWAAIRRFSPSHIGSLSQNDKDQATCYLDDYVDIPFDNTCELDNAIDSGLIVRKMFDKERELLLDYYKLGYSTEELATKYNTSTDYIKSRIYLIIKRLRKVFGVTLTDRHCSQCSRKLICSKENGYVDPCYSCRRVNKKNVHNSVDKT